MLRRRRSTSMSNDFAGALNATVTIRSSSGRSAALATSSTRHQFRQTCLPRTTVFDSVSAASRDPSKRASVGVTRGSYATSRHASQFCGRRKLALLRSPMLSGTVTSAVQQEAAPPMRIEDQRANSLTGSTRHKPRSLVTQKFIPRSPFEPAPVARSSYSTRNVIVTSRNL